MPQPFKELIERDDEKQEKRDVGHAAHHRDIGLPDPAHRRDMAARGGGPGKAEGQRRRGGDGQQDQNRHERRPKPHVLARREVTGQPF